MILTLDNPGARKGRIATVGSFDGVHRGHRCLLNQLIDSGKELELSTAVITFRQHPRGLTLGAVDELTPLDRRLELIAQSGVDDVILLDFDEKLRGLTAQEFLSMIRERFGVEAILLGFNNGFGSDRLASFDEYVQVGRAAGVRVLRAGELVSLKVSSTAVREALAQGDVAAAARMLGREYELTGHVAHGRALGRTIGFPTANVEPDSSVAMVPGRGVYVADVVMPDGSVRRAIMNIGHRPTVESGGRDTIEVHVLDFDGDLYGQRVTLRFLSRLRGERAFPGLESLRRQLERDAAAARMLDSKSR